MRSDKRTCYRSGREASVDDEWSSLLGVRLERPQVLPVEVEVGTQSGEASEKLSVFTNKPNMWTRREMAVITVVEIGWATRTQALQVRVRGRYVTP